MPTYNADESRIFNTLPATDVILAFAARGVALDTIASAVAVRSERVSHIVMKGVADGVIQRMPPITSLTPLERRDAMVAELVRARETIADLQQTIRELTKASDDTDEKLWRTFGLTGHERMVVASLMKHESCSKARLYLALYGDDPDGGAEPKIIDVFVCKIRKKLAKHGIKIETIWGNGYRMPVADAAKLRELIGLPTVESPPLQATQKEMVAA